jgi:hypothetical protein
METNETNKGNIVKTFSKKKKYITRKRNKTQN